MIALAVILSAVISQFALQLQSILQQPVQAGVTFDEDTTRSGYDVSITWTTKGTVSKINAGVNEGDAATTTTTPNITRVGQSINLNGLKSGTEITVVGITESGRRGVIQSYTVGS